MGNWIIDRKLTNKEREMIFIAAQFNGIYGVLEHSQSEQFPFVIYLAGANNINQTSTEPNNINDYGINFDIISYEEAYKMITKDEMSLQKREMLFIAAEWYGIAVGSRTRRHLSVAEFPYLLFFNEDSKEDRGHRIGGCNHNFDSSDFKCVSYDEMYKIVTSEKVADK